MRVNLSKMPDSKKQYSISIGNVYGGLNLRSDPEAVSTSQSPDMLNMWYRSGSLRKRAGQKLIHKTEETDEQNVVWYSRLYNGYLVWKQGNSFYYAKPDALDDARAILIDGPGSDYIGEDGDFLPFGESLYYKAPGTYIRFNPGNKDVSRIIGTVIYTKGQSSDLTKYYDYNVSGIKYAVSIADTLTPVIAINRNADGTGGNLYQPENRISKRKEVWFDVDTASRTYYLPAHGKIISIKIDGEGPVGVVTRDVSTWNQTGTIKKIGGKEISFETSNEKLPDASPLYTYITFGEALIDANEITVDEETIDATSAAQLSNRLKVVYESDNDDAFSAIALCKHTIDYGGSDSICIVTGNTPAQPNAIFWTGNGSAGVDATYFPMDQYNLCGSYHDPINAFGKFSSFLIVLQEHQTGKCSYSIEANSYTSRAFIDLQFATVNPDIGCDVPDSVQLCSNNLVWANTRNGIMYMNDTSYANENTIVCISSNVNGNRLRPGLLQSLRDCENPSDIRTADDGSRYYIFIDGEMWCWDYSLASVSEAGVTGLSWTRHDGFDVTATNGSVTDKLLLMNRYGDVVEMSDEYDTDFDEPFHCHYTTPTQTFGGPFNKYNVVNMTMTCASEKGGYIRLKYCTERNSNPAKELYLPDRLSQVIKLVKRRFNTQVVLKPNLQKINHFNFTLYSDGEDGGISFDSATVLYTVQGVNK